MKPRAWLVGLARLAVPMSDHEIVLGDLEELYARRAAQRGRPSADLDYLRGAIASAWALRVRRRLDFRPSGMPWSQWADAFRTDVRSAIRSVLRAPGLALMVVGTLALGIGSATAVFGMVNQLILRPLPGTTNSDRAAYLWLTPDGDEGLTLDEFDEVARRATLLEGIASYGLTTQNASPDGGRPTSMLVGTFYGDFFEVLGVEATAGRVLSGAESGLDADPLVAVISASLRDRLFGTDEAVVGRHIEMSGHPVEVVGVAPPGFRGVERGIEVDAWMPHGALVPLVGFSRERLASPRSTMHRELVVLPKPGVPLRAVEEQMGQIVSRLSADSPDNIERLSRIAPVAFPGLHTPPVVRNVTHRTLRMMGWAVGLIFAIACANVANLLLFQNVSRRATVATTRALGASTGRLARQRFVETLLLALAGAVAGLGVAWLITLGFRGESLVRMPAFEGFHLDGATAAFVTAVAILSVLLCGVAPSALSARFDLGAVLRSGGNRATGRIGGLRTALSAGQIGLTLALVTGGLLMVRTIRNYRSLDTGVNVEDVAYLYLLPPDDITPEDRLGRYHELLERTETVPGVTRAALDVYGPHGSSSRTQVALPGQLPPLERRPDFESLAVAWQVSPSWFEVFGVAPTQGRTFTEAEWSASSPVAVLTGSLASHIFGRTDVVGRTVEVRVGREREERVVVGVVPEYTSLARPSAPTDAIFLPFGSMDDFQASLMVKLSPRAPDAPEGIRRAAEAVFPDTPVPDVLSMSDRAESAYGEQRLLGRLLGILSAFGVLLSAVGLFGGVYLMVNARRREFSIRRALGADGLGVVGVIVRAAAVMVGAGSAIGLVAAFGLARVLQSRLFEVGSSDPVAYLGALAVVVVAAALACLIPARAALEVDPVNILREQ
jgi:predicted permease